MNPLERKEKLLEEWSKKPKKNPDEIKGFKNFCGFQIEPELSDEEVLEGLNSYYETVNDYWYEPTPKKTFSLSSHPFDITELQYLRGLVFMDKLTNDYEGAGKNALIAQNKTMYEFTDEVMKKIDDLEDKLCKREDVCKNG